jgi:cytochrome b subunit of formate dehydrogenase
MHNSRIALGWVKGFGDKKSNNLAAAHNAGEPTGKRLMMAKYAPRLLIAGLIGFSFSGLLMAAPTPAAPPAAVKLDNASCQSCHDGSKSDVSTTDASGKKRALKSVKPDKFAKSVHAKMQCTDCHQDITDATSPHTKGTVAKADCVQCHQALWETAKKENKTKDHPRLGVVAENIEAYKKSLHAKPSKDDNSVPNARCDDCHNSHSFNIPAKDSPQHDEWRLSIPETCGSKCHEDQLETYTGSVHGKQVLDKHNPKGAVCTDCHTTHAVGNTSAGPVRLGITAKCGSCHEESYKSYKGTYHGQITSLGYAYTAKCFDCHGSHDVLATKDPKSKVHPDNRMKTCRTCHNGKKDLADAPPGFSSFQPHGHDGDFMRYPNVWLASKLMTQLLIGTFAFFWLHTILWFFREFKERQQRKGQPHVKIEGLGELPPGMKGKHFQRFSRTWRIAHITFALSLMLLTLTGIPLFYAEAPWAAPLMAMLGGPHKAGLIHRVCAVIFAGVFFWHLVYITIKLVRGWKEFKVFGPNSLIPGIQDLKDIIAMFKWFLGKAPRPVFDRWTYWEKFDYWAPFWGVTIIGVSGLMMWLPNITAKYLPGWVFNVAAIFHSEEAFLAVVFLFTVHFFNNHFRPDKFPLELVMFTGTMTIDELKHDHPLQYQRLLESGELEKYLVDAPSAHAVGASKVLGFVLIVIGLTLLTLVGIGFFTS